MSGSRAIAAAINRRTTASAQQQNTAIQQRPGQNVQRDNRQNNYGQQQQQQQINRGYNQEPGKKVYPKLSVSDAIALTTIRLGRVETFINSLPPLDQIGYSSNQQQSSDENLKVVDEAVFKNIVMRLDKLESAIQAQQVAFTNNSFISKKENSDTFVSFEKKINDYIHFYVASQFEELKKSLEETTEAQVEEGEGEGEGEAEVQVQVQESVVEEAGAILSEETEDVKKIVENEITKTTNKPNKRKITVDTVI
jgi:hypothetical protein